YQIELAELPPQDRNYFSIVLMPVVVPVHIAQAHPVIHRKRQRRIKRQTLLAADYTNGREAAIVASRGRRPDMIRVRAPERKQRPLASLRRFTEIVFELPPFVAWHIGMNQVIPL